MSDNRRGRHILLSIDDLSHCIFSIWVQYSDQRAEREKVLCRSETDNERVSCFRVIAARFKNMFCINFFFCFQSKSLVIFQRKYADKEDFNKSMDHYVTRVCILVKAFVFKGFNLECVCASL